MTAVFDDSTYCEATGYIHAIKDPDGVWRYWPKRVLVALSAPERPSSTLIQRARVAKIRREMDIDDEDDVAARAWADLVLKSRQAPSPAKPKVTPTKADHAHQLTETT